MNKIIKNILILFVVILFLSTIINAFVPFYWGDYTQTTKILHYKENPNKYNALFFGGSLEYRHINPSKVDASLKKQNVAISNHLIWELMGIILYNNYEILMVF
jgi:hypothetical protein